jgi:hypothetical protein
LQFLAFLWSDYSPFSDAKVGTKFFDKDLNVERQNVKRQNVKRQNVKKQKLAVFRTKTPF